MLDTEETDTLCTEADCACCVFWSISVCAYAHCTELVYDIHELHETWVVGSVHCVDCHIVYITLCTIE